ncbi:MAG: glycine cleavage system protein GcvH [Pseudomonadota bacterium]
MSDIPSELKYTKEHEWVRTNDDGNLVVGITDHAQAELGEIVFVEMPEVDADFAANDEFMVVESVKAASEVYCPVGGTVIEINEELEGAPELVNSSPYESGWLVVIKPNDMAEVDDFMDADGYAEFLEESD